MDRKFETEPIYLVSGLILGFVMSMYIVYVRYGREEIDIKNGGQS